MKFKKTFLRTACALALVGAGVSPVFSNLVAPQAFSVVQAQETLTTEEEARVAIIKDNVAGYEPVNLEQLLDVSDRDLLEYDNIAQTQSPDDVWGSIYEQIAQNYPQLELLQGEDYDAYGRAAQAISERSEYTFSDLNMALPRLTLERYRAAMADNEDDVDAAVAAIIPDIDQTITDYIDRRTARENAAESNEDEQTDAEKAAAARQELLTGTPITEDQLAQIDDATLVAMVDEINQTGGDPSTLYNRLVENHPDVFASESERMRNALVNEYNLNEAELDLVSDTNIFWEELAIFNEEGAENFERLAQVMQDVYNVSVVEESSDDTQQDADVLRQELLTVTPMLQAQLDQFDDATLVALADELNQVGADIGALYNRLVEDYPDVFASESDRMRNALVNEYGLDETALNEISDATLFWHEFTVFGENNGVENFGLLANRLVEEYDIPRQEESGESESQSQSEAESQSQAESESEEASRSVSVESSIESNQSAMTQSGDLLPETGETSSTWLIFLSVVLLIAAGYLIFRGRAQQK